MMFKQLALVIIVASTMVSAVNVNFLAARATTTTTSTSTSASTTTATSTSTTSSGASTTTSSGTSTGSSSSSSVSSSASTSTSTVPTPVSGAAIHPNGNNGKCMDVRGGTVANGTPVQIYDCNGTNAQKWAVQKGQTKVRLAGTNFCLDAGNSPGNGVGMKIWTCYDNLAAQQWYYTGDNRIALFNKGAITFAAMCSCAKLISYAGQCLDLTGGRLNNGNQLQTWKCTDFNTNQVWST